MGENGGGWLEAEAWYPAIGLRYVQAQHAHVIFIFGVFRHFSFVLYDNLGGKCQKVRLWVLHGPQ